MFDLNREKQSIAPNQRRTERISEAYLLSAPLNYPTQDERRDFLSGLSPLSVDPNETSSSLNPFLETPSNFDLDDDGHFNDTNEKVNLE